MKSRLLAAATAAAVLGVPAVADAAGTVVAGPVKVRDYKMTVVGTDAAKDSLTVMFLKSSGKSTQQHVYSFSSGVKVTRTSIKGSLGKYGAVNLKLRNRRTARRSLPKGCTGSPGRTVVGTFTGSFRLVADKTYFRTVRTRRLPAVVTSNGSIRCGGDGSGGGDGGGGGDAATEPTLTHSTNDGGGMFTFIARPSGQMAMRIEDAARTAPASISHMINGAGTGLTLGGAATATAKGLPRFLGGTGTFAGSGTGPVIPGVLSGDLVARFDSIDDVRISGDATLMTGR